MNDQLSYHQISERNYYDQFMWAPSSSSHPIPRNSVVHDTLAGHLPMPPYPALPTPSIPSLPDLPPEIKRLHLEMLRHQQQQQQLRQLNQQSSFLSNNPQFLSQSLLPQAASSSGASSYPSSSSYATIIPEVNRLTGLTSASSIGIRSGGTHPLAWALQPSASSTNASAGDQQNYYHSDGYGQLLPADDIGPIDSEQPLKPAYKRHRTAIPDWVDISGEYEAAGKSTKKRFKMIYCKICATFNPQTPWAKPKLRKHELLVYENHEQSTSHVKAVIRQCDQLSVPVPPRIQSNVSFYDLLPAVQFYSFLERNLMPQPPPESITQQKAAVHHSGGAVVASSGSGNSSGTSAFGHLTASSGANNYSQQASGPAPPPEIAAANDDGYSDGPVLPLWLHMEGKLCHSEAEMESGRDLTFVKKRYRMYMCTYCAEYNEASPWGYLRPRKLESAMLNSHEVSGYHQTALERMNESNLSGGDQSNDGHNGLPEIAVMSDLL